MSFCSLRRVFRRFPEDSACTELHSKNPFAIIQDSLTQAGSEESTCKRNYCWQSWNCYAKFPQCRFICFVDPSLRPKSGLAQDDKFVLFNKVCLIILLHLSFRAKRGIHFRNSKNIKPRYSYAYWFALDLRQPQRGRSFENAISDLLSKISLPFWGGLGRGEVAGKNNLSLRLHYPPPLTRMHSGKRRVRGGWRIVYPEILFYKHHLLSRCKTSRLNSIEINSAC